MNTPSPHIIQRQTVRLHLREQADGWAVQERVGRVLQQAGLLSALDAVLSGLSSAEEWIELERVELDLGVLLADRFETEIARRLPELLRRQLIEVIPETRFRDETATRKTGEVVFDTFLYFLLTGLLPATTLWPDSHQAFEKEILDVIAQLNSPQKERLKTVLAEPPARSRLLTQFSNELLTLVFGALQAGPEPVSLRLLNRARSWRAKLTASEYETLLNWLIEKAIQEPEPVLQTIENRWTNIDPAAFTTNPAEFVVNLIFDSSTSDPVESTVDSITGIQGRSEAEPTGFTSETVFPTNAKPEANPSVEPTSDTVFYVQNAGIVLLHPFLSFCFEACGWVEKSVFVDNESREKALTMIHFLATGEPQAAEYDLLLPKLLCETPWNSPVSEKIVLTVAEQEEGIGLLNAAIAHWSALKNTSPDGLRDGFLQRDGKLVPLPDGRWELTVESKAQDVLLSRLPYGWSVGTILLPWMKKRLTVNWG